MTVNNATNASALEILPPAQMAQNRRALPVNILPFCLAVLGSSSNLPSGKASRCEPLGAHGR